FVWPGTYSEEITFEGKAITVRSAADAAVLTAPSGYACSFSMGESAGSVLANFVITGCGEGGIFCDGTSPTLKNLTIVKNQGGVLVYGGAEPTIVNCIIWKNTNLVNNKNVSLSAWMAGYGWNVSYSCIDAAAADKIDWNIGNIDTDPLFANLDGGDYHLRSRYGRYVSSTGTWALDSSMSPCIDGGDPSDDPRNEPADNGGLINMGAYGGTRSASKSGVGSCP
ncbi:MAG: right-handed parallel beta-helix repeat-containing protein, partial [Solirubrobacterales bacterium]